MIIGYRLRELRNEKELTQQALANIVGVSKVSISGYETGTRIPSVDVLNRLLDYFDISADFLMGREITAVFENERNEKFIISKDEMIIIKELRKNKNLFNSIMENPKRFFSKINV